MAETPQETIAKLEKTYIEHVGTVNKLRTQVVKLQEQLVEAHMLAFKSLQEYTTTKEQYLLSIVEAQKQQIVQLREAAKPVDVVEPVRADNVEA